MLCFAPFSLWAGHSSDNNVAKIIGGEKASNSAWPWMTGIAIKGLSAFQGTFCGGSLVHRNWVMTAAHCVVDNSAGELQAVIGRTDLTSNQGEIINVDQIIIHPNYKDGESFDNDIALLRLDRSSVVEPIRTIGQFGNLDDPDTNVLALGWGATDIAGTSFPEELRQVEMVSVSNTTCDRRLNGLTENMLCAGFVSGGKDTCSGDSGGPIIAFSQPLQAWHQIGITSWGVGDCAQADSYGVYTRLDRYKDFISATVCSAREIPATPSMRVTVDDRVVSGNWSVAGSVEGYRLYYAPFPGQDPINSIDMLLQKSISVELNRNDAFFTAVSTYNGNCRSNYSNIESFTIR